MLALTTIIKHQQQHSVDLPLGKKIHSSGFQENLFRTLHDLGIDFFFPSLLEIGHKLLLFLFLFIHSALVSSCAHPPNVGEFLCYYFWRLGFKQCLNPFNGLQLLWVKSCITHTQKCMLKSKLLHHLTLLKIELLQM